MELMHGGMGFIQPEDKPITNLDEKVARTAVEAARRKFSPEFMNRLDKIVVFHPLNREQLAEVLQIELSQVQQRVLETANGQFLFRMSDAGREFLLREGTDQRYGARHLKRAIERHVVFPLANLLATGQVQAGDMFCIDWDPRVGGLVFWKEDKAPQSTAPHPLLVSTQTRKAAGADSRAAEVTSSAEARSAGSSKPSTRAY
jgi:ATP-dependent Clp protease ATP-binding subunit ClpB